MVDQALPLIAQAGDGGEGGGIIVMIVGALFTLLYLAMIVLIIAGGWKVFSKAGQPGWGVLIPFYNIYLTCLIAGRPGWWLVLFLIPVVNLVVSILICIDVAKAFGQSAGFGIGIFLLGFVFVPILGYGQATYQGPPN